VQASWPIPSNLNVINVNGYPLTYVERGAGVPLILVHGSTCDYRAWKTVLEPLAARYRAIAPNLRHYYPEPFKGDGGNFSAEQHADDLAELVKVLKLDKAHWLGWSRGGLVMVEVQKRHPGVVRTLIFEDGNIEMPVEETEETREAVAFSRLVRETLRNNIRTGDLVYAAEVFVDTLNGKGFWSRMPGTGREMVLQNIYTALSDVARPLTTREQVSRFDAPVLLLTGERSPKRYAFFYDEMRKCRSFPQTVVVPNASHSIHIDNPERFVSVVLDFLKVH
jgi:pimeloyl-ACP methyl ester carboxylesterase